MVHAPDDDDEDNEWRDGSGKRNSRSRPRKLQQVVCAVGSVESFERKLEYEQVCLILWCLRVKVMYGPYQYCWYFFKVMIFVRATCRTDLRSALQAFCIRGIFEGIVVHSLSHPPTHTPTHPSTHPFLQRALGIPDHEFVPVDYEHSVEWGEYLLKSAPTVLMMLLFYLFVSG